MECSCKKCGMGVKGMKCNKCNCDLVEDTVKTDKGQSVKVAKCPKGCGKIKSPMCCGEDMQCCKS